MGWNRSDWQQRPPEQLDLYALVGRPKFDPDRIGLLADIKTANRELHEYQNHASKQIATRARDWQLALAKARKTLENAEALHEAHQELLGHLVEKAQTKGLTFELNGISRWLQDEEKVHSQLAPVVAQALLSGNDEAFFSAWNALMAPAGPPPLPPLNDRPPSLAPAADNVAPFALLPPSAPEPLYAQGAAMTPAPDYVPPAALPMADLLPPQIAGVADLPMATPMLPAMLPADGNDYRVAPEVMAARPQPIMIQVEPALHPHRPSKPTAAGSVVNGTPQALSPTQLKLLIAGGGLVSIVTVGLVVVAISMASSRLTGGGASQVAAKPNTAPNAATRSAQPGSRPSANRSPSGATAASSPALPPAVQDGNLVLGAALPGNFGSATFGAAVSPDFYREGNAIRISHGVRPTWSPGAKYLAFAYPPNKGPSGRGGVGYVELSTRKETPLLVTGREPAWSPDGRYVAYVRGPGAVPDPADVIHVFDFSTRKDQSLGRGQSPHWRANDGRLLYWASEAAAVMQVNLRASSPVIEVWSGAPKGAALGVSPDGQQVATSLPDGLGWKLQITRLTGGFGSTHLAGRAGGMPVWHPSSPRIAVGGRPGSGTGLWVVEPMTGREFQAADGSVNGAAWSPNGNWLAFDLRTPTNSESEIWLLDANSLGKSSAPFRRGTSSSSTASNAASNAPTTSATLPTPTPTPTPPMSTPPISTPPISTPPSSSSASNRTPGSPGGSTSSTNPTPTSPPFPKPAPPSAEQQSKLRDSDDAMRQLARESSPWGESKNFVGKFKRAEPTTDSPTSITVRFSSYTDHKFELPRDASLRNLVAGLQLDEPIEFAARKLPGNSSDTIFQLTSLQRYGQPESGVVIKAPRPMMLIAPKQDLDSDVSSPKQLEWDPSGRWLAVLGYSDGVVLDTQTGATALRLETNAFAWAPVPGALAAGLRNGTFTLRDLDSKQDFVPPRPGTSYSSLQLAALAWQPAPAGAERHKLLAMYQSSSIAAGVFDVDWKRKRVTLSNLPMGPASKAEFTRDGKQVALVRDSLIVLQPTGNSKITPRISRIRNVESLEWHDNVLGVVHRTKSQLEYNFLKPKDFVAVDSRANPPDGIPIQAVEEADWSADGQWLACYDRAAGSGNTVRLRSVGDTAKEEFTLPASRPLPRFSPNSRLIALPHGYSGGIAIWDIETREMVYCGSSRNNNYIYRMSWSPDGSRLATIDSSGRVRIWEVPKSES